jgi:hypothetical protein
MSEASPFTVEIPSPFLHIKFFKAVVLKDPYSIVQFFNTKAIGVTQLDRGTPLNSLQQIFLWALANNEKELESFFLYSDRNFCCSDTPVDFIICLVLNKQWSITEKFLDKKSGEKYCEVITKAIFVSAHHENHEFTDLLLKHLSNRLWTIKTRWDCAYYDAYISSNYETACVQVTRTIAKFGTVDQLKSICCAHNRILSFAKERMKDNNQTFYESVLMSEDPDKISLVAMTEGKEFVRYKRKRIFRVRNQSGMRSGR